MSFFLKLRALILRRRAEAELSDELQLHLELQEEVNRKAGMSPEEAHHAARRQFGHVEGVKESLRDQRSWIWLEQLTKDFRFAARSLSRSPVLTTVAVLTLAMGIGAVAAMFSAIRATVLEPFAYPHSERLVQVWSNPGLPFSAQDYLDMRSQVSSFEYLGAYSPDPVNLGGTQAKSLRSIQCTSEVLRAFGVIPALGRWLEAQDEAKGAPLVTVISHQLWMDAFGGDQEIVGKLIHLNGQNATVVGVMPAAFEFNSPRMAGKDYDLWLPLSVQPDSRQRGYSLFVVGRLKEGVSRAAANSEVKAIGARFAKQYPDTNARIPFLVESLQQTMTQYTGPYGWMLLGAVFLLLLVACSNVASMLLARSACRQTEYGVRLALGASRVQLLRLGLCESFLLSLLSVGIGLGLAYGGIHILQAILPATEARKAAMVLDGRVLWLAVGLSIFTSLISGLPSALATWRFSVVAMIGGQSRSTTGSVSRHRLLRSLVVSQIVIAFVLANGAALLLSCYQKILSENRSLATDKILSAEIDLLGARYEKTEQKTEFWDRLITRVGTVPGVAAVGIVNRLPLEGGSNLPILVNDETFDKSLSRPITEMAGASPGYFEAAGIKVLRGRTLTDEDNGETSFGVVVNRTLAERCWAGQDALGKIIRPNGPYAWFQARVVGVVEDVRQGAYLAKPEPQIYWPAAHAWSNTLYLIVRTASPYENLIPQLRKAVSDLDPDLALSRIRTLNTILYESTDAQRGISSMMAFFMAMALILVAVGFYGTMAYLVQQRTREIGVRLAVGAQRKDVAYGILTRALRISGLGLIIGIPAAYLCARLMESQLFGIGTFNPLILFFAVILLLTVTVLASLLPARRAMQVNPVDALRAE